MEGKTHIVGGLAAGALYLNLGGAVGHEALFFGSLALGALIPDICVCSPHRLFRPYSLCVE